MEANNMAAMRKALECIDSIAKYLEAGTIRDVQHASRNIQDRVRIALAAPPHTGKWMNGMKYEYEFAYCSECGRTQWADWDSHKQAEESIGSFADDYRYCPGCGAKMEGGVYVK